MLQQARDKFMQLASQSPVLTRVRPNTLRDEPQYQVLIDDEKARALGVSLAEINSTLSIAWGGRYVNDFIDRGRVKKVYLQGVSSARMSPEDLQKWYVRNDAGEMVPFSAFATGEWTYGSPKLSRYNGVSAIEMLGEPAPATARVMRWPRSSALPLSCRLGWVTPDWTVLRGTSGGLADPCVVCPVATGGFPLFGGVVRELVDTVLGHAGRTAGHRRRACLYAAARPFQRGVLPWAGHYHWSVGA